MIRWTVVALALLQWFAVEAAGGKKPVTLEAVAASRDAGAVKSLAWAPDGTRFAFEKDGAIRVYDVASRSSREVVREYVLASEAEAPPEASRSHWRNRRVREQKIQWFPSGDKLLLTIDGDLFVVRLPESDWVQLTSTPEAEHDPKLSPDGRRVSLRRGHDLYVLDTGSRKVKRLTRNGSPTRWNAELDWVYPEELNLGTAHWWSPNSKRIAYLQFDIGREMLYPHADLLKLRAVAEPQRYPQAGTPNADVRLGVVSATGGRTRWLGLGDTRDALIARVHWLPDSKSLAVQRLNRVQNRLELLIVPARGGKPRTLLEETDPYWVNITDDLRFLENSDQLLWTSERDGRRHIYLYSLAGDLEARLTSGEWEVTGVAGVDESRGRVYFLSTEESPLERHLYSVKLDGRDRRRLTQLPGVHGISMSPACQYYLDNHSNQTQPPRRTVHDNQGEQLAIFQEADRAAIEEYELLPAEVIQVRAPDGARLYARLTKPAGFQPGEKHPAVVLVYGGPHAQQIRDSWRGANWAQALAHRGFVVWQLDNRGSAGRGHAWEAKLYRRFGKQELADQREGVRHLISLGFVDPSRIGIYGWSYGGFMTIYSLLHAPELFRAGVAGAAVTDWRHYDTIYTERYLGLPDDNEEGYRLSSPVHFADQLTGALLLLHNFEDDNVLFQHTLRMADALERADKPFEMMIYPQKAHGVTGEARKHMLAAAASFLERHLKR